MANAIEIRGLRKSFGRTTALDGLDLEVRAGEVHAFLGPNGAGKTTTIRILLGLLRKDGGEAVLLGGDPWRDAVDPAPPAGLRPRRRHPVARPDRRRDHRPARPAPRRPGPQTPPGPDRTLRPGPRQEGPRLLQGQPAEGGADRRAGQRRRAPAARRADRRPGPAHGGDLPRLRHRGTPARPHRPAVQPHPGRGRGAVGPGDDHPRRPHGGDRHAGRDAPPDPGPGRRRDWPARSASTACPGCTTWSPTACGSAARWTTARWMRCWAACTRRASGPSPAGRRPWRNCSCVIIRPNGPWPEPRGDRPRSIRGGRAPA